MIKEQYPICSFELETKLLINQFRSSLTNNFLLFLAMIQDTTQANALFSALQSNYYLYVQRGRINDHISISRKSYIVTE
jgi:hypothetical protein